LRSLIFLLLSNAMAYVSSSGYAASRIEIAATQKNRDLIYSEPGTFPDETQIGDFGLLEDDENA
jgi:hypothetical protein